MEEVRLPQHVVQQIDRRWRARFGQLADAGQRKQRTLSSPSNECDRLRSSKVQRLREGSLRPTMVQPEVRSATNICGNPSAFDRAVRWTNGNSPSRLLRARLRAAARLCKEIICSKS
jgi:hypothetical protein